MKIEIAERPVEQLVRVETIPIAFQVRARAELGGDDGLTVLGFRTVEPPWVKDYDTIPGNAPSRWGERFDVRRWGLLVATHHAQWIGAATIAFDAPGCEMLGGRDDVAVLWDIRVAPQHRGRGIGSRLFASAEEWARGHGCTQLIVETQDINAPAITFYQGRGCEISSVVRGAYADLPAETQLLLRKRLQ